MDKIIHGDCLVELKKLKDNSVDLLCTDPPYGYSFMGKNWDKAVPSVEIWKECLRVLKPGGFAFIMSAPRQDVLSQMIVRIGEAGFNTNFTSLYWTYASGFPKAMNIGKMVDKRAGVEREVTGTRKSAGGRSGGNNEFGVALASIPKEMDITAPATDAAKALDGSYGGFQPKPAVEVIIVAMKPLSEKTFVDQALKNGKGITWLDDCRVPTNWEEYPASWFKSGTSKEGKTGYSGHLKGIEHTNIGERIHHGGRFPANLLVENEILADHSRYFSLDSWADTLPFLITPKANKSEKNEGLGEMEERQVTGGGGLTASVREDGSLETASAGGKYGSVKAKQSNFHPTVKPLKLMAYLITLGSRPGDTEPVPEICTGR
jgi:hypothetical protein